jgi:hypothetical protein
MSMGLKVALIIIGVFIILGALLTLLVTVGVWQFARRVDVDQRSGQVTIRTEKGAVTLGEARHVSEAELGIPLYPGAQQAEGGVKFEGEKGAMATYVFKTSDSVEQVVEFYKQRVGAKAESVVISTEGSLITLKQYGGSDYMIAVATDHSDQKTVITITRMRKGPGPAQ